MAVSAPRFAMVAGEASGDLLAGLGGTCHSPIAVLSERVGDRIAMRAALLSPDGAEKVEARISFAPGDMAGPRALAQELLAQASPAILIHFDPPERH